MTKYYLKGQLVRTSKTHDNYKYCLVCEFPNGKLVVKCCSSTINGAGRDYNYYRNYYNPYVKVYIDELEKVNA